MEDLNYEGKGFEFWGQTGVVLSSEKRTETTAHQTAGRVNSYGKNIDVSMPTTTFSSVLKHDFWIKKKDGAEEAIHISGIDIPLRPEQEVTMIYAAEKGKGGCQAVFVNHSAGKSWFINNSGELFNRLNVFESLDKSIVIALVVGGVIGYPVGSFIFDLDGGSEIAFACWIAVGVLSYRRIVGFRKKLKFKKLLDAHLASLTRNILQKT